jgi:hypothetical protein
MTAGEDLSTEKIDPAKRSAIDGDIEEEAERRRWKSRVLLWTTILIAIFYSLLAYYAWDFSLGQLDHNHIFLLLIIAAVPSLALINLMRMVSKTPHRTHVDLETNPWFALGKEILHLLQELLPKK